VEYGSIEYGELPAVTTLQHNGTRVLMAVCFCQIHYFSRVFRETPAPLVAEMLGYSYQISQRHADLSGTNWARYPPTYMSWAEHVKDPDVKGYLTGPGLGLCDRMHHDHHDGDRPPA
jgi:hypothetical protein